MFLILHGWGGSDAPHWQAWLAQELAHAGKQVSFPALPNRDFPRCDEWIAALAEELRGFAASSEEVTVVCHSLAVPLWLHYIARFPTTRVAKVLLVAPPGWAALNDHRDAIGDFAPVPLDADLVAKTAGTTRLVCSDGDPYCIEGAHQLYGTALGIPVDRLPSDAGHVNVDAGFGPWPAVLEWCIGTRASVAARD